MLTKAILYKEEIEKKFQEARSEDMFLFSPRAANAIPDIADEPEPDEHNYFQFAIVDSKHQLVGYISYYIDWRVLHAFNFHYISFDKGNIVVGKAIHEVMDCLINKYKLRKISWSVVCGNHAEKMYDKFCMKYNGQKKIFRDCVSYGKYADTAKYEIIL